MSYDEFFTDGDKPYAENLNDSLALLDAFDVTVPCSIPEMFSNGEFNSTVNVTRKCGVALVTLKSVDSGVTVGTGSISGTGSVVFRVYPNFNSFYKWSKIILEKTGTVSISFRKTDGTEISATVGSDGTISESSALKQLQEIDVVFTLASANISNILIWFINNQSERTRTGALLEASQLVNVNGTVTANDGKAVSGDTVKTALDNLHSTVTGEIEDLSDSVDSDLSDLSDEVDTKLTLKEDKSNKVTTLDNSSSHYPSCSAVKNITDNKANASHTHHKYEITDMYTYEISASDYNVDIDSTVTINVKVKTMGGNPVAGMVVPVLKNNKTWQSGTTDVNGTFSLSYTADMFGLVTFSLNGNAYVHTQIKVGGWKTLTEVSGDNIYWKAEYNETHTRVRLSYGASQTATSSETAYGTSLIDDAHSYLRPILPVMFPVYNGNVVVTMRNDQTNLTRKSTTGSTITMNTQYWQVEWPHQGLP